MSIQYNTKIIEIEFLISTLARKFKLYFLNILVRVKFNIIRSLTYFSVIITCFTWLLSILTATSVQRFSLIIKYLKIKGKYVFDGRTAEFYNLFHKMGIPRGHVLNFYTELWTLRKIVFLSFIYITFLFCDST